MTSLLICLVSRSVSDASLPRTFHLFKMLGIEEGKLGDRKKADDPPKLVPYSLTDDEQPSYFNGIRRVGDPWKMADPFELNKGVAECDQIPTQYVCTTGI